MTATTYRRTPFTEFVLKLNTDCQLACRYCYMYELADAAVRGRGKTMSPRTVTQVGSRITEHARTHDVNRVRIVWHGGEPLLSGAATVADATERLRAALGSRIDADFSMQTNALLLTDEALETLTAAGVQIGVSLDGDRVGNDRHRLFRDGRSSYDQVVRALDRLRAAPESFGGILSVIDLASDPVSTYESLVAHQPPAIDFLLPHGNWTAPPPGRGPDAGSPYGDWLSIAFDRWYNAPHKETRVRLFEEIINGVLGGDSGSEAIGLSPVGLIVVDTDGALEQVDALRSAFPGARGTGGLNVFDDTLDRALDHEAVIARQSGAAALSEICLACDIHRICGGGYYPHRYREGQGFRNPSVYCADLRRLIAHVSEQVLRDVTGIVRRISDEKAFSPG
jgi:uncharacterized protein